MKPNDKQEDVVVAARAIIANHHEGRVFVLTVSQYDALPELLRALADEVERLRRGEFTPEEFQNLCHNTDTQAGFDAFADGCEAYQRKMFGRCRAKGKVL